MKKITLFFVVFWFYTHVQAQKITLISGSLLGLKSAESCTITYQYDNMIVGKKKENEYIKEKVAKYNQDEAGRGDKWAKAWVDDRAARFEPKLEELFNKHSDGVKIGKSGSFQLVAHTTFTEPGFNVGVWKQPASINMTVIVLDKDKKQVAELSITQALGRTYGMGDFDTGVRIGECYAVAGKGLGKFISKAKK